MLPTFDRVILEGLNHWVHLSPSFDNFVSFLSFNNLLKGALFSMAMWWLWFQPGKRDLLETRQIILAILAGCLLGMLVTRVLTHAFPARPRPLHNTELHLKPAQERLLSDTEDSSSFPSDHATLFFALATGFCFLSRRLGVIALLYVTLFVCLPRLYLGLHYPSDILAGALIGVLAACIANAPAVRRRFFPPVVEWQQRHQSAFYVGLSMMTYQIADLFAGVRQLISYLFGLH